MDPPRSPISRDLAPRTRAHITKDIGSPRDMHPFFQSDKIVSVCHVASLVVTRFSIYSDLAVCRPIEVDQDPVVSIAIYSLIIALPLAGAWASYRVPLACPFTSTKRKGLVHETRSGGDHYVYTTQLLF